MKKKKNRRNIFSLEVSMNFATKKQALKRSENAMPCSKIFDFVVML